MPVFNPIQDLARGNQSSRDRWVDCASVDDQPLVGFGSREVLGLRLRFERPGFPRASSFGQSTALVNFESDVPGEDHWLPQAALPPRQAGRKSSPRVDPHQWSARLTCCEIFKLPIGFCVSSCIHRPGNARGHALQPASSNAQCTTRTMRDGKRSDFCSTSIPAGIRGIALELINL